MTATGGHGLGDRDVERAGERRAVDELHDHAVHRLDSADADDRDRFAAGDERDDHGADSGYQLHVHGAGVERQRRRGRSPNTSNAVTPTSLAGAGGADGVSREPAHRPGAGQLDRADEQWRQPDHGLHGHAVHRLRAPQTPVQVGYAAQAPRPSTGSPTAPATRSRSTRDQRDRDRSRVGGLHRGDRRRTRSSISRRRPTIDSGRRRLGRARREVHLRSTGTVTGHPLLQGGSQHRHARRQPVDRERHAAGLGDVHERDGLRLAAGQLLHPGRDQRRTRPTSPPTSRPTATTPTTASAFTSSVRQPAADSARQQHQRQRRLRLQRARARSRPAASTRPTTGSTSTSLRPRPRRAR